MRKMIKSIFALALAVMLVVSGSIVAFAADAKDVTTTVKLLDNPLDGVTVEVKNREGDVIDSGVTDSNGKVTFSALPTDEKYYFTVDSDDELYKSFRGQTFSATAKAPEIKLNASDKAYELFDKTPAKNTTTPATKTDTQVVDNGSVVRTNKPATTTTTKATTTKATTTFNTNSAVEETKKALAENKAAVVFRNAPAISKEAIVAMQNAASGKKINLAVDTLDSSKKYVDVRVSLPLDKITGEIDLSGSTTSAQAQKIRAAFEKKFSNDLIAVAFNNQTDWASAATVAVKLDSKLTSATLNFYRYDRANNTYYPIDNVKYTVDEQGYVHFAVAKGGDVIISNGPLTAK